MKKSWIGILAAFLMLVLFAVGGVAEEPQLTLELAEDLSEYFVAPVKFTFKDTVATGEDWQFDFFLFDEGQHSSAPWSEDNDGTWVKGWRWTSEEDECTYIAPISPEALISSNEKRNLVVFAYQEDGKEKNVCYSTELTLQFTPLENIPKANDLSIPLANQDGLEVLVNDYMEIVCQGPADTEAIYVVYDESGLQDSYHIYFEEGESYCEYNVENSEKATIAILGIENGKQVRSEVLTIQPKVIGEIAEPEYKMTSSNPLPNNKPLTLELGWVENAESYSIQVYYADEEDDTSILADARARVPNEGETVIASVYLPAIESGTECTFKIHVYGNAGYESVWVSQYEDMRFTVTDSVFDPDESKFILSGSEKYFVDYWYWPEVTAPGAASLSVDVYAPDGTLIESDETDEHYLGFEFHPEVPGDYMLQMSAMINDVEYTETQFIHVEEMKSFTEPDFPAYLIAGEKLEIRFPEYQDIQEVEIEVDDENGDVIYEYSDILTGDTILVPGDNTNCSSLTIYIDIYPKEDLAYRNSRYRRAIPVMESAPREDCLLVVSRQKALVGQTIEFTLNIPEGIELVEESIAQLYFCYRDYINVWQMEAAGNGAYKCERTDWYEWDGTVYASIDTEDGTIYTEPIAVQWYRLGDMTVDYDFMLEGLDEDGSIPRDGELIVRIPYTEGIDMFTIFAKRSGIDDEDSDEQEFYSLWEIPQSEGEDIKVSFPVLQAEEGSECRVSVQAYKIGHGISEPLMKAVTVSAMKEEPADGILLKIPETVTTGDDVVMVAYAPDAIRTGIYFDAWGEESVRDSYCQEGETYRRTYIYYGSGEYTIVAWAEMEDGEIKTVSKKQIVTSLGEVDISSLEIPTYFEAGRDAVIDIPMQEEAECLSYNVYTFPDGENEYRLDDWNIYEDIQITIPGGELVEGRTVTISVAYDPKKGYDGAYVYYNIPVVPASSDLVKLTCDVADEQVPVNAEFNLTVHAEGASELYILDGNGNPVTGPLSTGDSVSFTAWSGRQVYYAMAVIDGEEFFSEPFALEGVSKGKYPGSTEYTVSGIEEGSIPRDGMIIVHVPVNEDLVSVSANICRPNENENEGDEHVRGDFKRVAESSGDIEIQLPVISLEAGTEAYLQISASYLGYDSSDAKIDFKVTDFTTAAENGIQLMIPEETITREEVYLVCYVENATEIAISSEDAFLWGNQMEGELIEYYFETPHVPGNYSVTVTAMMEDGTTNTLTRKVAVTAPKGKVSLDTTDIPEYLVAGEEQTITLHMSDQIESYGYNVDYYDEWDNYEQRISGEYDCTDDVEVIISPESGISLGKGGRVEVNLQYQGNPGYDEQDGLLNISIPVKGNIAQASVEIDPQVYNHAKLEPVPQVVDTTDESELQKDQDYLITGYSDNENVGTAKITLQGIGDYAGTAEFTFDIQPVSLEGAQVLGTKQPTYTGEPVTPIVNSVSIGGEEGWTLDDSSIDVDFMIETKQDYIDVADVVQYRLKGIGNYTGYSRWYEMEILRADIEDATAEILAQKYTREEIEPEINITFNGKTLIKDKDYTATFSDNTEIGTAKATLTGMGNFQSTKELTFLIAGQVLTEEMVNQPADAEYTGEEVKPAVTVQAGNAVLAEGTDYTVSYQNNINAGTASVIVTGASAGEKAYAGTITKTFTIQPKALVEGNLQVASDALVYDGTEKKQAVMVTDGDRTLEEGTDYTVSYADNMHAGTAKVTITGKGNYAGEVTGTFTIQPKVLDENATVTLTESGYTYDGTDKEPEVTVQDGDVELTEGTDYLVSYKDNQDAGTATVTITGQNDYSGTITAQFTIEPMDLSGAEISDIAAQTYTGSAIEPEITVAVNDNALILDTDYTVSITDNVDAGKARVTIAGKGNYTGTRTTQFTIAKADISTAQIDSPEVTYTGVALRPEFTVTFGETILKQGTDYTVTYSDNVNAGTGKAVLTGKGSNFTGTLNGTFQIIEKDISKVNVYLAETEFFYDKTAHEPAVIVLDGSNDLSEGTDYTVVYENNTEIGTASVVVTGKGNYTGAKTVTFAIVRDEATERANQAAAAKVNALINALPEEAGVDAKDQVTVARAAYDALTEDQKALISEETLKKLTDAEASVKAAEKAAEEAAAQKAAEDEAAAAKVKEAIEALPESAGLDAKDQVAAARAVYDALTEDQKALISEETLKKLTDAEDSVKAAEKAAEEAAAQKAAEDEAAAAKVKEAIEALPESSSLDAKDQVAAARDAYDALTEDQKALISEETLKKLTDAEASVKAAESTPSPVPTPSPTPTPVETVTSEAAPTTTPTPVPAQSVAEEEATKVPVGDHEVPEGKVTLSADGTVTYNGPAADVATVTIPDTVTINGKEYPVTKIADKAFYKKKKLTTIKIGANIVEVGKSAFASCAKLKTVKGGKNIAIIRDAAFSGCKALKSFPTLSKLKTIGANAFKGCVKLTKFTLGAQVESIGKNAFNGCKALKNITIKTTKLTKKNVKSGAFKGISDKTTFKCPKKMAKSYETILKKKGAPKTSKFK